jgi:hypothetical protein
VTLLEALVGLVIIALVAVGVHEVTATGARAAASSAAWRQAVVTAESAMDAALVGVMVPGARVTRAPRAPGLELIEVHVPAGAGATFTLRRLVATAPATAGGR